MTARAELRARLRSRAASNRVSAGAGAGARCCARVERLSQLERRVPDDEAGAEREPSGHELVRDVRLHVDRLQRRALRAEAAGEVLAPLRRQAVGHVRRDAEREPPERTVAGAGPVHAEERRKLERHVALVDAPGEVVREAALHLHAGHAAVHREAGEHASPRRRIPVQHRRVVARRAGRREAAPDRAAADLVEPEALRVAEARREGERSGACGERGPTARPRAPRPRTKLLHLRLLRESTEEHRSVPSAHVAISVSEARTAPRENSRPACLTRSSHTRTIVDGATAAPSAPPVSCFASPPPSRRSSAQPMRTLALAALLLAAAAPPAAQQAAATAPAAPGRPHRHQRPHLHGRRGAPARGGDGRARRPRRVRRRRARRARARGPDHARRRPRRTHRHPRHGRRARATCSASAQALRNVDLVGTRRTTR